jgi:two-component system, chemotaxis family, chemotaxis protein CheY
MFRFVHWRAVIAGDDDDGAKSKKRDPLRGPRRLHVAKSRNEAEAAAAERADVLIVEDDPDCREILHDILVHAGHVVSTSVDRGEALELLARGKRPTLIIMDLMMPNIDTASFQTRLKLLGLADVPIIAISAATEREVPTPKGAHARFLKPIDLTRLLAIVNQLVTDQADD